jgi:hypothetical protein
MRASIGLCLRAACFLTLLLSAAGCAKEVKAEFPRPPATATLPPPEEEPEGVPPAPVLEEPEVAEPVETASEVEEEAEKPRDVPPRPPPRPPADEEPKEAPPSTTLTGVGEVDLEIATKLERASSLLESISRRNLTSDQADQLVAARGFVAGARQAIAEGDPRRALVLIDKGLLLAEDVDRMSRP